MALLVEGLGVGVETSIEEYIIGPVNELGDNLEQVPEKGQIMLYGAEGGVSCIAKPVSIQSTLGQVSHYGSLVNQSPSLIDPMVTLFGSVQDKLSEMCNEDQGKNDNWDVEGLQRDGEHRLSDASAAESDGNLYSPLLRTILEKDTDDRFSNGNSGEPVGSLDIGGGWQLAYKWSEEKGEDGENAGELQRIYLYQDSTPGSRPGSIFPLAGGDVYVPAESEFVHASALVSQSAIHSKDLSGFHPVKAEMVKPSRTAAKGASWADLFEPGVRHALVVGVGIQMLQQFSGISGVLYYTPQILEQAGVGIFLSNMGIGPDSTSLLLSAITAMLMLPSVGIAMRLMDVAGRRWLLLFTLPILLMSLVVLVLGNVIDMGTVVHAIISTVGVVVYFCSFVMGFGPIPNILCSEIFPTRVRGLCIAICTLTGWIADIIVTYTLPVLLTSLGLGGVFAIYAVVCSIALVFVYLKVPETKGMPLEVISEFFAVGAKKAADAAQG